MSASRVLTLAVLVAAGIQGLKFIAPWYDYLRLKGAMQESVGQAQFATDAAVISVVQAKAEQLNVPLAPRDIHVERSPQRSIRLWAEYDVTLNFPLGFSHTQRFRPEVNSGR
jgi:hypothetical protein